jgi:hypothetical protein
METNPLLCKYEIDGKFRQIDHEAALQMGCRDETGSS